MIKCRSSYIQGYHEALGELLCPFMKLKDTDKEAYEAIKPLINFINSMKHDNVKIYTIKNDEGYIPVIVAPYVQAPNLKKAKELNFMDKSVAPTISTQDMDKK